MKAKTLNFKKGSLYYIKFHDHHVGADGFDYCEIVGWFHERDDPHVIFNYWQTFLNDEIDDENLEHVKLVEVAIIEHVLLL